MYCPNCGAEVDREDKYCSVCGRYLSKRAKIEKKEKDMKLIVVSVALALVIAVVIFLPEPEKYQNTVYKKQEKFSEIPEYNKAYKKLELALASGDVEMARRSFDAFYISYIEMRKKAGEEHIKIVVPPERLKALNESIAKGDLDSAKEQLSNIGNTCGVELCHSKSGSAMYDFATSYYAIKRALNKGDFQEAIKHLPEFRQDFYRMREQMLPVMPEITRKTMREEYINELEDNLKKKDISRINQTFEKITREMCSTTGCHSIITSAKLTGG